MDLIELHSFIIKDSDQQHLASLWTYRADRLRLMFTIRRAHRDNQGVVVPCPVNRFEVVKLSTNGHNHIRIEQCGVVTCIRHTYKFPWRTDYRVSVKRFGNILDAIEYSEKKRGKYEKKGI